MSTYMRMTTRTLPTLFKRGFAQQHTLEPSVLVQKDKGVRKLIMNRPRRLNALDMDMMDIFYPNLKNFEELDEAKIVLFKGIGRALCAGGDVKDVIARIKDPSRHEHLSHQLDAEYEMVHLMGTMKTPYIAVMDGITMGAGGGMACPAPFRIATENTQFAMPETAIGLFCDIGASFHLSRLDGHLGAYMGLTSRIVKAEDTLFSGIATHFVHSSRLEAMESRLAELETPNHDMVHKIIEEFAVDTDHKPQTYTLHGDCRRTIDSCFNHGTVEEVVKSLEEDGSKFALETKDTILMRSPTGVKVTFEHLRQGLKKSWVECLRMEHRLWQTVPYAHDLVEGVTSHIINKTTPNWNPKRLEDLDLDQDIRVKFFYANVKKQLTFWDKPLDYHLHPYRRYGLPSQDEILEVKAKHNLTTVKDTVDWFEKDRNGKFGVRQKVEDALARLSQTGLTG